MSNEDNAEVRSDCYASQHASGHALFHMLTGLLLSLFIISLAVTLALNMRFIYYGDIDRYDLTGASGLTREELKEDYSELIDYNCLWGDDSLDFPHFPLSDSASQHFAEARNIFLFFGWGVLMFGIPALLAVILAKKKKYGTAYLLYAAFITLVLPVVLGAACFAAWDKVFVLFHEVSFGNDLWLFDPAVDPVIKVLPDQFFLHEALAIFVLVVIGGILCLTARICITGKTHNLKER